MTDKYDDMPISITSEQIRRRGMQGSDKIDTTKDFKRGRRKYFFTKTVELISGIVTIAILIIFSIVFLFFYSYGAGYSF